jgi:hypothetical protein
MTHKCSLSSPRLARSRPRASVGEKHAHGDVQEFFFAAANVSRRVPCSTTRLTVEANLPQECSGEELSSPLVELPGCLRRLGRPLTATFLPARVARSAAGTAPTNRLPRSEGAAVFRTSRCCCCYTTKSASDLTVNSCRARTRLTLRIHSQQDRGGIRPLARWLACHGKGSVRGGGFRATRKEISEARGGDAREEFPSQFGVPTAERPTSGRSESERARRLPKSFRRAGAKARTRRTTSVFLASLRVLERACAAGI